MWLVLLTLKRIQIISQEVCLLKVRDIRYKFRSENLSP